MMEDQFMFLNIIIVLALVLFLIILLAKFIIYEQEVKLNKLKIEKDIKQLEFDKAKAEQEKISSELEMAKLQIEYADFMKNQKVGTGEGYGKAVEEVMKEVQKRK